MILDCHTRPAVVVDREERSVWSRSTDSSLFSLIEGRWRFADRPQGGCEVRFDSTFKAHRAVAAGLPPDDDSQTLLAPLWRANPAANEQ